MVVPVVHSRGKLRPASGSGPEVLVVHVEGDGLPRMGALDSTLGVVTGRRPSTKV